MNEREIFQAAVDILEPAQRQAYLDQACGTEAALRARIEALLASHATAGQFLNVPAIEQIQPPAAGVPQPTRALSQTAGATGTKESGVHADNDHDDDDHPAADLSFLQPSSKPGSIGTLGHYEILQVLGQGAFGIVFKAFDEKLHRVVAIKAMNPNLATTSPPRKRFLREARSVAAIKHENIVQVYGVDELPLPYLVMEYVDGPTLQQKLDRSGPLEIPELLHIARQIASGLGAAHAMGLIHRDIKPGNILLERGGDQKVKITDFGLARAADDASLTRTGVVSGTPMYMAPEQALGQALDHRADLFSLGCVLYQMACGRPPFRAATTVAVLRRVAEDTPRPLRDILPDIPEWLVAIVNKLLAKKPDERYQSAQEVAEVLRRCQSELPLTANATSVAISSTNAPAESATSRRPRRIAVLLAVLGILLFAFGTWLYPLLRLQLADRATVKNLTRDGDTQLEPLQSGQVVGEQTGYGVVELPAAIPTSLASLDPAQISAAERFPWQPKELVAVVGSHRFRHWGPVTAVAFSPDGGTIASTGMDGFVRLWDKAGRETAEFKTPSSWVNSVAFSPDRRLLVAGGENGVVYGWKLGGAAPDERTSLVPAPPSQTSNAPNPGTAIDAVEFSANGKFLACSVGRQTNVRIVLWDCSSWPPRELPALPEATAPFAFAADSKTLYTQHGRGGIAGWDLTGERPEKKTTGQLERPRGQLLSMAISPNGKLLATCHGDATAGATNFDGQPRGDVVLWDLAASPPKPKAAFGEFKHDPMFYMLDAVAFSPDSHLLAFAANGRRVELWDVAADPPKKKATLPGELSQAGAVTFSVDGTTLAAAGNSEVRLWELANGSASPRGEPASFVDSAAVSPTGRWLATSEKTGSEGEMVARLWDLSERTPQPLASTARGMPFVFGADGKLVTIELGGQGTDGSPGNLRRYEVTADGPREAGEAKSPAIDRMLGERRMHPGGVVFALGDQKEGELSLWRIGDSEEPVRYKLAAPGQAEIHPNAAAADGSAIAANVGDFQNISVKVWKFAKGAAQELATVRPKLISPALPADGNAAAAPDVKSPPSADKVERNESLESRPFQLWTLAVAPAGAAVALADLDGTIQIWQLAGEKPRLQASFVAHRQGQVMGAVQRMTFSNDGRYLLTVGSDRKLSVWDAASGTALYTTDLPGIPNDACFAADGRHVWTLNPNGTLYVLRLPESL